MADISITDSTSSCKDFQAEKYGRLTTIEEVVWIQDAKYRRAYQQCVCSCGTLRLYRLSSLKSGDTQSCGCLMRERSSTANGRHRRCRTPEYRAWGSMLARCHNTNHRFFRHYGGRGIVICERWLGTTGFSHFLEDIGARPSPKHSLDRIDNNGNYEPSNCRWATRKEQANNKRSCRMVTIEGTTDTLSNWCRKQGISYNCVQARLRLGWDMVIALTKPVAPHKKHSDRSAT